MKPTRSKRVQSPAQQPAWIARDLIPYLISPPPRPASPSDAPLALNQPRGDASVHPRLGRH